MSSRLTADRVWAATAIGLFGRDAKAAIPGLIERLYDDSPNVRGASRLAAFFVALLVFELVASIAAGAVGHSLSSQRTTSSRPRFP
jgi:hypothetical protein